MKNKILLLTIVAIILLAYIVLAVAGDGLKIVSPVSGTNYTNFTNVLFNITFVNGSDITQPANATFFLNISGVWTIMGNTSATGGCQVGATTSSCAVLVTNNSIPDGVYSINATIYNATSSARISVSHIGNLSNSIYLDSTRPIIFAQNFSSVATGRNYSQLLVINISAIDETLGVQTVMFNITNSSGGQNATVTATREGSTSNYVTTINTSHYVEGSINITAYINDSLGNLNNSARVYQLLFDNTLPSITHSCDDYIVEEDDEMDCTCSATDSLSGLNTSYGTSGVSYTSSPSTSNTGNNRQTTCTALDKAGNLNTSIRYYNVTGISGSSSSGGSSGGSSSGGSSSSSTNSTSNNNSQNSSTGNANSLQGNQENQDEKNKIKINYWKISLVILGIGLVIVLFILIRKKITKRFK
ncbi:MAG: hypothetical protein AABX23_03340 [Nanoarchaeota archaeon]